MKNKYLIVCLLGLSSCVATQSNDNENPQKVTEGEHIDTVPYTLEQNRLYCFIRTEGTENQDTTKIHFMVNNHIVEGQMKWAPKEKDGRSGVLTGTISGDKITVVWHYIQEGQQDSITLDFVLSAAQLTQRPLKTNMDTGRQETDVTVDYSIVYLADDCN